MTETIERPIRKVTRFTATDEAGTEHSWAFWYDSGYKAWFLRDCDGYERRLAENWVDSVPRIKTILRNYGMSADIS